MKRIITISLYGVLCLLLINRAYAQDVTVKGTVTDAATGETLIGVSVAVKSTQTGAQTGPDGTFTISAPANAQLTFSYIGYATQTVAINGRTTIDIKLATAANELQQVVVVGYGTQRKIDVTGSVASIKGEEISKQASINPVSALQGKVAGVRVTNLGAPGASPEITIRGTGTIYGKTKLLYVVDGVWYDDIAFLNPGDIENMSILKDASSTAIYGIRAANGVVLVTTNRGRRGANATFNYNGYAGWQTTTNRVKMANATEYATVINELNASNGAAPLFADPSSYGAGTDWYGQILRDAFVTKHEVSVNGGGEKSAYNFSLGYLNQDGNVKGNNYKRYTIHLANDYQVLKPLKVGFTVNGVYSNSRDVPTNAIFHEMFGAAPVVPVYYADGSYGDPSDFKIGDGNNYNPQVTLDFFNQNSKIYRFTGNAYAELKFLKNFTFKTSFGGDFGQNEVQGYNPVYTATLKQRNTVSVLTRNQTESRNWIAENTLTYDNQFGDHKVTVLLGQTALRDQSYRTETRAENVPPGSENAYLSVGTNILIKDNLDDTFLRTAVSYFGRLNYSFKGRYLLNASLRQDGASQFYGDNLYAWLPAVGAGWVITEESFMKDQNIFNTLKLRGSWGKVGNAGVPFNPTNVTVARDPYLTAIFGGVPTQGGSINVIPPSAIILERGVGTDVGLEAAMLNNRLSFEVDYYNRTTEDAIFDIPILTSLGTGSGRLIGNQAEIRNRGLEFLVTWRDKTSGGLSYSLSANMGINKNTVINVITGENPILSGGGGIANGDRATRTVAGRPVGEFYGYQVVGVFQNQAEITGSLQPTAAPGDLKFADTNGDGKLTEKDRVGLGDPNAKYSYGFNTNFGYKNFDLALDFQGIAGVSVYNANIAYRFGNENFTKDFYDNRWHGEGTSTMYPSANVGKRNNAQPNSNYVESGAYFRVRNVQLGYTLPGSLLSKWKIQRVRLYANAQNPLTFFKYKGFSPEVGGSPTNAGIDANVYPLYATYNFGVNVTF